MSDGAADRPSDATPTRTPAARAGATFAAGDLVAQRYRIVRYIAQGGMGEVYEAEDERLQTRVALKTVRAEIAEEPEVYERFKREILLARKVTHPNVCRIFDVAEHLRPGGESGAPPLLVLTMELLDGETLHARIRRAGPMTVREAAPILEQVIAALGAAHAAGVVHRDVKSGNVILVPSGAGPPRAVVTDFGLAREDKGPDASGHDTGQVAMGTVAYMSPEQMLGGQVTFAADIYALGVVMYEVVTGRKPFASESVISTLAERLQSEPRSPRELVPDLDPRWEKAILRCLRRRPQERFARVGDVQRALVRPYGVRALLSRARLATAGAVLLAVGLALVFSARRPPPAPQSEATPVKPRRSVAVLGFKNLSNRAQDAWLSTALAEMLATELGSGEHLRIIPGENVGRLQRDLGLSEPESLGKETLNRIHASLGSDTVIFGSYLTLGEGAGRRIRVDLRVQDAAHGESVTAFAQTGLEQDLFELVLGIGARVRERLSVGGLSAQQTADLHRSVPAGVEAQRAYAEGLASLRRLDAVAARRALEQAIAAQPDFPLSYAAMSEAYSALGYDTRALEVARRAFDLSERLPQVERLRVEARYRETAKQWETAIGIYRRLLEQFPDDIEHGLRLASVQTSAGQAAAAFVTLDTLRRLPPPTGEDPRIDLSEADAATAVADFRRALRAAERAISKGRAQNELALVAKARLRQGWVLERLGRVPDALAALEDGQALYASIGQRGGVAWALRNRGFLLYDQGERAAARRAFDEALLVFRDLGDRRGLATTLNLQGTVLWELGDAADARLAYAEALATFREIADRAGTARALGNLAKALDGEADLAQAKGLYEQSLSIFRELRDANGTALVLNGLGVLERQQGDLRGSRARLDEALALVASGGPKKSRALTLHNLGVTAWARGELDDARARLTAALELRRGLADRSEELDTRLALAALALDEGRGGEAAQAAQDVARQQEQHSGAAGAALAHALVARAQHAQGLPGARAAAERGRAGAGRSRNTTLAWAVLIQTAPVVAATASPRAAAELREHLQRIIADARRTGRVELELQARLARGEAELTAGGEAPAQARLAALARDAELKGFGLIARRARELAGPGPALAGDTGTSTSVRR